jgi:hypothetical protein
MAFLTILRNAGMGTGQRIDGIVVREFPRSPFWHSGIVASRTIVAEVKLYVVRTFCLLKIGFMTIHTGLAQRTVLQFRCCFMTFITIDRFVHAYERKRSFIVYFGNVFNDPGLRGVATRTIIPDRLVMHVAMAAHARRVRFLEI